MAILDEKLIYEILSVVSEIPKGSISTYKQIACFIGREKNARLVGKILSMAEFYGKFPCHRVVNAQGRLVPNWDEQYDLLKEEGITFKKNGNVDVRKHLWNGN